VGNNNNNNNDRCVSLVTEDLKHVTQAFPIDDVSALSKLIVTNNWSQSIFGGMRHREPWG
jgi:hypothetical protein